MKTTDLIPFILLELKEHDKYGFELTKAIETKSNGNIIIKQPTLYTILKKLEKSRFITSYWEDSEIGGKRHYYKITENGLKQTETLPDYCELLKNVCGDDFVTPTNAEIKPEVVQEEKQEQVFSTQQPENKVFSIFDHLQTETENDKPANTITSIVEESILPTEEVFASNELDTSTELEINRKNTAFLKEEETKNIEHFATNENVAKFTENIEQKAPSISTEIPTAVIKEEPKSSNLNSLPEAKSINVSETEIPFVEYEDIRKSESYIYAKSTSKKLLTKMALNCLYLLAMLITCYVITSFVGRSKIFYIVLITAIVSVIFIPALFISQYKNIKIKLQKNKLKIELKKRLIAYSAIELLIIMLCMVCSIIIGKNSVGLMFSLNNFANMYAPIILSSTLFFDLILIKVLFLKNK